MHGSFLGNGLSQVPHCSRNELGMRLQRGSYKNEGKRWKSTQQILVGQLQPDSQEHECGVPIPALPQTEPSDFS